MAEITKAKKAKRKGTGLAQRLKDIIYYQDTVKKRKAKEQGAKDLKKEMRGEAASMVVGMSKKKKAGEKLAAKRKAEKAKSEKMAMRKEAAKYTAGLQKKSRDAKKTKSTGTKSVMSDAQKKGQAGTRQTKKDLGPKGSAPKSVSAAQKAGKLYFMDKNNKPKLAITAEQLTKFMKAKGIKSRKEALTKFANTYKPGTGMAKFKADMKKMAMGGTAMKKKGMAMGGSMKKKGMARGGMKKKGMAVGGAMKKKGMARGGMKKKGYAMGGLKATNPSQVGLRKLPQNVRNKMGYMKKGGMTKKGYARGGSMKKKGYAMGGVAKKYGIVDNRKNKR